MKKLTKVLLGGGVCLGLVKIWDWVGGKPDLLKGSRAKALDDLLFKSGYQPSERWGEKGRICIVTSRTEETQ